MVGGIGQHVEIARWNFGWATGSADVGGGVMRWFLRVVRGAGLVAVEGVWGGAVVAAAG